MREDSEGRRKGVQVVSGTAGLRDVAGSDFRPVPPGTLASAGGGGHSRRVCLRAVRVRRVTGLI